MAHFSPKPGAENPQHDRFIETARQLGCDEDKERFEKKLGKITRVKPAAEKAVKK